MRAVRPKKPDRSFGGCPPTFAKTLIDLCAFSLEKVVTPHFPDDFFPRGGIRSVTRKAGASL